MREALKNLEEARQIADQLFHEGFQRGFPIAMSHLAVQLMLRKRDLPMPDDILAWASGGYTSDTMVKDWDSVDGGLATI